MKVTIKMDNGGTIDTYPSGKDSQNSFCKRVEEMIMACFKVEDLHKADANCVEDVA